MRMLWLEEDCRKAGLKVVPLPGWKTRGAEFTAMPTTVLCHHTATPAKARGDLPTKRLLIEGRSDLPGPLCQVALGRNGTVYLVSSGKAQHAGKGAWRGETTSARTLGIEAEHPGDNSPWPKAQYDAYVLLVATLLRGLGQGAGRTCSHAEWALPKGRKTDVRFDMDVFRCQVAAWLDPADSPTDWSDMATKDEIRAVIREELAAVEKRLHNDHVVMIRGTASGTHPWNLKTIAEKLGIKG